MRERNLPEVWEVEWVDSTVTHGWGKTKDVDDEREDNITTVGFLVKDDEKRLVLTASSVHMPTEEYDRHTRFDCLQTIPKCAVRKMKRMRKARD